MEHPINSKRRLLMGTRPVATGLSLQGTMGVLYDVADVSTAVLEMLNDLSGFDIREFVAPGDDRAATDRMLTGHFEIGISAVVKLVSKGVTSSEGKARVVILEEGFRSGLRQLRQHCVECRSRMRIGANFTMMADLVNLDLNRWAGRLFDDATDFAALYDSPPSVREFPDVPEWTRLSQYIGAGGLRNSQHQPRSQSSPPGYGRDRSTTLPSGKKGYCFAWASTAGCGRQARHCDWEHAHDPSKRGGGNRGGGRGGADHGDTNDRASGGDGNGSAGGGGGGGSTRNEGYGMSLSIDATRPTSTSYPRAPPTEAEAAQPPSRAPRTQKGAAPGAGSVGPHFRGIGRQLIGRSVADSSQRSCASGLRSWCAFRRFIG